MKEHRITFRDGNPYFDYTVDHMGEPEIDAYWELIPEGVEYCYTWPMDVTETWLDNHGATQYRFHPIVHIYGDDAAVLSFILMAHEYIMEMITLDVLEAGVLQEGESFWFKSPWRESGK